MKLGALSRTDGKNTQKMFMKESTEHQRYTNSRVSFYKHFIFDAPEIWQNILYALTSRHINRFSKLYNCQNQDKICNYTITKDPTTPQVCCYTTL